MEIPGYNITRNDRDLKKSNKKKGGGVCIYTHSSLKVKVVAICPNILQQLRSDLEFLFVEYIVGGLKYIFGVIYNPPRSTTAMNESVKDMEILFAHLSTTYDYIILSGDFNLDILNGNSPQVNNFKDTIGIMNLSVYNLYTPTHFAHNSPTPTLIDLLLVNDPNLVEHFNQISISGISHHDLIYFSLDIDSSPSGETSFYYRDMNQIDHNKLINDFMSLDWNGIYVTGSTTEQVAILNDNIKKLYDENVPIRRKILKPKEPPWLTNEIKIALKTREHHYALWRFFRTEESKELFHRSRNRVTSLIRREKSKFLKTKLDPSLPPKLFWKNVRSIGIGKSKSKTQILFTPNSLNSHFAAASSIHQNNDFNFEDIAPHENSFCFSNITSDDLLSALSQIKSEAIGVDGIDLKFIKLIYYHLVPHLTHIFNLILTSSVFPDQWKVAKIIPIPKVKHPKTPSDYRPISILPCISKIFENILSQQIINYINSNSLLTKFQSGFRSHHSTTTALLKICDDIRINMNSQKFTGLVLLDFTKAFDNINHALLCNKLITQFTFSISATKLISSYLVSRSQMVVVDNEWSDVFSIISGVPQGSILGPLIFSLYINDIQYVIKNCSFHVYADDIQIYNGGLINSPEQCINELNEDLRNIDLWSKSNYLKLNPTKSKAIIIYKREIDKSNFPNIKLNNDVIKYEKTVKNLGIILNENLNWLDYINKLSARIYGIINTFWRLANINDIEFKKKLVIAFVFPHFIYADTVLFGCSEAAKYRLRLCFNACIRYIYGLKKFDHISPYSKTLLGCSLSDYYDFRVCHFISKLLKSQQPVYLYEKLNLSRNFNTNLKLIPIGNSCWHLNSSFSVKGIMLWNTLPLDIKIINDKKKFQEEFLSWKNNQIYST